MSAKVFKMHKRIKNPQEEEKTYSIDDFRSMDLAQVENRQFYIFNSSSTIELEIHSYYEIKKQNIKSGTKELMILQMSDVSSRIRYDILKEN